MLVDIDGSLTGYTDTVSVNVNPFFDAPVEAVECRSDNTAKASLYDYLSTVVYPHCAIDGTCAVPPPDPPKPNPHVGDWDRPCTTPQCYGIPLTRQLLTKSDEGVAQTISMMGQAVGQRNSLTVNNGVYYVDTTVGREKQIEEVCTNLLPNQQCSITAFQANQIYYLFLLYAKPTTKQTYLIYVGKTEEGQKPVFDDAKDVWMTQGDVRPVPVKFTPPAKLPAKWKAKYDPKSGILRVDIDLADQKPFFDDAGEENCRPFSYCKWDAGAKKCNDVVKIPSEDSDAVCRWAVAEPDCPKGGCFGIGFKLPKEFKPDPKPDPRPAAECFPKTKDVWDLSPTKRAASDAIAGDCRDAPFLAPDFCAQVRQR